MEITIGIVDTVLSIADIIEAVAAFSQRSDIRKFATKSQQLTQAAILLLGLVSIIIISLSISVAQAIYREWQTALPIAIVAYREGYGGDLPVEAAIEVIDDAALIAPIPSKPSTATLRSNCKAAGIRWRNAHGKNKHLTATEMRTALERANASIELATKPHAA